MYSSMGREHRPLLGGFASRYRSHYGGGSPDRNADEPVRVDGATTKEKDAAGRETVQREHLRRRMSRRFPPPELSSKELAEWRAEHSWRTKVFMTTDHIFYSRAAWAYGLLLFVVTLASCLAFVLSTMPAFTYRASDCDHPVCTPDDPNAACTHIICYPEPLPFLGRIEDATMVVFVVDYLLRVLTVHAVPPRLIYWKNRHKVHQRPHGSAHPSGLAKTLHYMMHINQIVDALVIFPFLFHAFFRGFVQLRLLRVTRVLRVLKLSRYSSGGTLVWRTLQNSGPALGLITTFTIVLSFLVGSLIFYFEQGTFKVTPEHPEGAFYRPGITGGEEVSPFTSAASGAYWVFVTATTVGYGDLYPTSGPGQVIAGFVALVGVVFLSLPIAIVVKHFNMSYDVISEEDELEKALVFEEEQARAREAAAQAQGGAGGGASSQDRKVMLRAAEARWRQMHVDTMHALRAFLLEQMRQATPLFDSMFEEFACKHMLHKLEQGDSAALSALERQEDGGGGMKDREAEGVAAAVVATSV